MAGYLAQSFAKKIQHICDLLQVIYTQFSTVSFRKSNKHDNCRAIYLNDSSSVNLGII